LNWSNTTGLYCFGEGILGFVTTGHFSVTVTLAGKAILAKPVLAQDAATTAGLEFR
jgi:Tfp pilus assembly protein PilZ